MAAKVFAEEAARLCEVHVDEARVVRSASRNHDVVDRGRQIAKEPLEGRSVRRLKRCGAQRVELARSLLEALGIPGGEDHVGSLGPCSTSGFESDAGATANDDHGLANQFRVAPSRRGAGYRAHDQSCSANACACVFP
jgi:hypothetical protein